MNDELRANTRRLMRELESKISAATRPPAPPPAPPAEDELTFPQAVNGAFANIFSQHDETVIRLNRLTERVARLEATSGGRAMRQTALDVAARTTTDCAEMLRRARQIEEYLIGNGNDRV